MPIFEPDNFNYKIENQDKTTKVMYQDNGMDCTEYISNSVIIDSSIMNNSTSCIKMFHSMKKPLSIKELLNLLLHLLME